MSFKVRRMSLVAVLLSIVAFATNAQAGIHACGFIPAASTDVNWIQHTDGYVYNTDSANTHSIVASLGTYAGPGFTRTYTFYLYGNGLGLTCRIQGTDLIAENAVFFSQQTTSASGPTTLTFTATFPNNTNPVGLDIQCFLPKVNNFTSAALKGVVGPVLP